MIPKTPECLEFLHQKVPASRASAEVGGGVKGLRVRAPIQADLREIAGSGPDHYKKSNIAQRASDTNFLLSQCIGKAVFPLVY